MNVLLIDFDSKWSNLALMKLAQFHKDDHVKLIQANSQLAPIEEELNRHTHYDKIYLSKIFDFPKQPEVKKLLRYYSNIEFGGSGLDVSLRLGDCIDSLRPNYSIYPENNYSIGFITRGCIRRCKWCVVPNKEGTTFQYNDLNQFCRDDTRDVFLLDNNFLSWPDAVNYMENTMAQADFRFCMTQAFDIRLLTDEKVKAMKKVRWYGNDFSRKEIIFAFDDYQYRKGVQRGLKLLSDNKVPLSHLKFYMLYDFDTTLSEDLNRLLILKKAFPPYGPMVFWMPYKEVITETGRKKSRQYIDCDITSFPKNTFWHRGPRGNGAKFIKYLTSKGVKIPPEYIPAYEGFENVLTPRKEKGNIENCF